MADEIHEGEVIEENSAGNVPALRQGTAIVRSEQIADTIGQLKIIREFIYSELKDGVDYGRVQGCGDKPVLLQPGAQKILMFFNVYPDYTVERLEITQQGIPPGHVEYVVKTTVVSRTTGLKVGSGVGSCSTIEKKYRYRKSDRVCPKCGADAIRSSKTGGFFCGVRAGGCGASFAAGDPAILNQQIGRVENEDLADSYNTVLKMAKKRSFVDATLSLSCIAEFFTQDLEERGELQPAGRIAPAQQPPKTSPPHTAAPDASANRIQLCAKHIEEMTARAIRGRIIHPDGAGEYQKKLRGNWRAICRRKNLRANEPDTMTEAEFRDVFAAWKQENEATFGDPAPPEDVPTIQRDNDWRNHPHAIEYNDRFQALVIESGSFDTDAEPVVNVLVKQAWVKSATAGKLPIRPDQIPAESIQPLWEVWEKAARRAIREANNTKIQANLRKYEASQRRREPTGTTRSSTRSRRRTEGNAQ